MELNDINITPKPEQKYKVVVGFTDGYQEEVILNSTKELAHYLLTVKSKKGFWASMIYRFNKLFK